MINSNENTGISTGNSSNSEESQQGESNNAIPITKTVDTCAHVSMPSNNLVLENINIDDVKKAPISCPTSPSTQKSLQSSGCTPASSTDCVAYDSDVSYPLNPSDKCYNIQQGSIVRLDQMSNDCYVNSGETDGNIHHTFTIGPPPSLSPNDDSDNELEQRLDMYEQRYGAEYYDTDNELCNKKVIVGICAMAKKAQSKPMKEILRRLEDYFEYIKTLVFDESVILNQPIDKWPECDCLISFHSKGFPLSKTIEYARLRRPFLINDLDIQYDIQDRRKVYKILEEADIELPRYAVLDRDSANIEHRELIENDDHIEVTNMVFNKPFVEKPISAEDHNICIYYPAHAGGGSQRLFRKIGCRSSVYSNESRVRKTGSYVYEEFMPTDGTDVKVYTAGPDYAHAEARKSPALDGKVERDQDGKEIRYPVILTNREKLIARKVCLAFKQTVCGFDLLRANGRSYVCDVNGFSFVKSSMKYYEDCSKILGNMMLRALAPQLHIPWSIPFQLDDPPIVPTTFGRMMELRCVIAVIRHGDRTPKQKMKLEVKHPKFFELYHKYGNPKDGHAKLKKPKQLQEVLDIARHLLGELTEQQELSSEDVFEPKAKLEQLKSVLEMYGHFSGINRKVQLKYQPHGRPRRSSSEDESNRSPSLVLILKWGGELTPAGRVQAEDLGRCFRRLYPASGDYSGPQGLGLLRLHSTFRHDLKIYASDEGRVQMTAGAFAKGFLALEGELTPILFQMVKSANTNGLLDNDCESSKLQKLVKEKLHSIMQKDAQLTDIDIELLNPTNSPSIDKAIKFIGNPYQACEKVYNLIKQLNELIKSKRQENNSTQEYHLYHGETWDLLQRRWAKLEKDFKFPKSRQFDISKIPDIYDCIKYDLQHNQHTLQFQFAHELFTYAKSLADIVIPQEYGMTEQEKLMIGLGICSPLLRKIQADLRNVDSINEDDMDETVNRLDPKSSSGVSSPDRHVRTRLYFTSESHIHSLKTAIQFGGLEDVKYDEQWQRSMEFLSAISELNYLSQIVIMLYEDPTKELTSDDRFHIEIHFSSGVVSKITQQNMPTEPQGPGFRPHLRNKSLSTNSSTANQESFDSSIATATPPSTSVNLSTMQSSANIDLQSKNKQQESNSALALRKKLASLSLQTSVSSNQIEERKLVDSNSSIIREELTDEEHSTDEKDKDSHQRIVVTESPNCLSIKRDTDGSGVKTSSRVEQVRRRTRTLSDECKNNFDEEETLTPIRAQKIMSQLSLKDIYNRPSNLSKAPISLRDLFNEVVDEGDIGNKNLTSDSDEKVDSTSSMENKLLANGEKHAHQPTNSSSSITCLTQKQQLNKIEFDSVIDANNKLEQQQQQKTPPDSCLVLRKSKSAQKYSLKKRNTKILVGEPAATTATAAAAAAAAYQTKYLNYYEQFANLPTSSYHTIHHWNFPTANIKSLASNQRYLNFVPRSNVQSSVSSSVPIPYKFSQNPRARSVIDVSQYANVVVGPSSLISTAVISGSSPDLVAFCPYSPTIRPLETLHNELSLRQFVDFISRLTTSSTDSLCYRGNTTISIASTTTTL